MRAAVNALAERHGIETAGLCRSLCMTWDEIAALSADPLVTIGAHTVNLVMLRKAAEADGRAEMAGSADAIAAKLGVRPAHFSYPVGDPTSAGQREFAIARELGFKTAVTTRPGVLFPEHDVHLTALPRISLNGEFQRLRMSMCSPPAPPPRCSTVSNASTRRRIPARQASGRCIQLISGIAGSIQPNPTTA